MTSRKLTYEYIRGLIDGKGSFTFTTSKRKNKIVKIPAFQIRMNIRDKKLLEDLRDYLELKNRIYTYYYPGKDGCKRDPLAMLIVREIGRLRNIIIPLFYNKLVGYKAIQFIEWLEKIGNDVNVPSSYKFLYILHKNGHYLKRNKFNQDSQKDIFG